MFSATTNYWLGATRDPGNGSVWYWVDGTQMTSETGWIFWAEDKPSSNPASVHLQIRTERRDVVFHDRGGNIAAGVLCEILT